MKDLQRLFAENLANNQVRVLPVEHDKDDVLLKKVVDSVPDKILGKDLSYQDKIHIVEGYPLTVKPEENTKLRYVITVEGNDQLTLTVLEKNLNEKLKLLEERLIKPSEVEYTSINKTQTNTNQLKHEPLETEKKFNFPLSASVKNAFTGASVEGYDPEKKNIEVRLANASYLKLQVADKTADYLKNNPDMPKLQIKNVKNHSLELGKTFIELTPDAVKFLNTKFYEKNVSVPEKLKISKEEITLSPEQRKDLGSGKPVNIGTIGKGKDDVYLMLNPTDDKKIMVLNAKSVAEPVSKVQVQSQPEKAEATAVKQEPQIKKQATANSHRL